MNDHFKTHPFKTIVCKTCGTTHIVPVYCGDRFCRTCGRRRLQRVKQRLDHIIKARQLQPGYSFKHMVFTTRSSEDIGYALRHLIQSFRKLRCLARWKRLVLGGAFVVEVTGDEKGWHVHIHVIAETKFYYGKRLSADWLYCSGSHHTFIKEVPVRSVVHYLTAYISKGSDSAIHSNQVKTAFKGKRLFQPFGAWHSEIKSFVPIKYKCDCCGDSIWTITDDCKHVNHDYKGDPLPSI